MRYLVYSDEDGETNILEIDHSDENERICELKKQGVDDYDIIDIPF